MEAKPRLLATPEMIRAYWPQVEPLLATAPIAGDVSVAAIGEAVLAGQWLIFVFEHETNMGPEVEMAMLVAPPTSDLLPTMTIITVAGKNLKANVQHYWEFFKGWCFMNGARAIDAYVPERMEGFMDELGLKRKSVHVRLCL